MAKPYENVPKEILKQVAEESAGEKKTGKTGKNKETKTVETNTDGASGKKQRRLIKKTRAGVELTRKEVSSIKQGRKKLRKELRKKGIRGKRDFEMMAGSLGLYFDKKRGILPWILSHWVGMLLASLAALVLVLFLFSLITQMRGHFTINLSDDMFKEGFVLSETVGFEQPTVELVAQAAENVPAISIKEIPADVDQTDGQHNGVYFAYTFYIRNDGENTVAYSWDLLMNSESKDLLDAAWIMLFEDGTPRIYAKANSVTGEAEALPPKTDNSRGYKNLPISSMIEGTDQLETVKTVGPLTYYRVVPYPFDSDTILANGVQEEVEPEDAHKYTVVMWLEGDDVDTDNSKINGHLGIQMNFRLGNDTHGEDTNGWRAWWEAFWDNLKFWE